jgi:hypothetical protein
MQAVQHMQVDDALLKRRSLIKTEFDRPQIFVTPSLEKVLLTPHGMVLAKAKH